MKRYLCELRDEELLKVYEVNIGLQQLVYNYEYEAMNQYVANMFHNLQANNAIESYNIDEASSNNFIVVRDTYEFFQNVESMLYNYGIDEPNEALVNDARDGIQWRIARDSVELHSKVYEVLDKTVDDIKDIVVNKVIKLFLNYLELNDRDLEYMFIEYVQNHEVFDNIYVTSDNYIAYEELLRDYKDIR